MCERHDNVKTTICAKEPAASESGWTSFNSKFKMTFIRAHVAMVGVLPVVGKAGIEDTSLQNHKQYTYKRVPHLDRRVVFKTSEEDLLELVVPRLVMGLRRRAHTSTQERYGRWCQTTEVAPPSNCESAVLLAKCTAWITHMSRSRASHWEHFPQNKQQSTMPSWRFRVPLILSSHLAETRVVICVSTSPQPARRCSRKETQVSMI